MDDWSVNFGPGPAVPESQPIPMSEIVFLHITEATQLQFTQAPLENSSFSNSHVGVQDLSRVLVWRPAGT